MKRIIAIMLSLVMLLGAAFTAGAFPLLVDETYAVGDADNDGKSNALDLIEIKKGLVYATEINEQGSDINCDGSVNAKDLLVLKKCHAGTDSLENYMDDATVDRFLIGGVDIEEFCIVIPQWATEADNIHYAASRLCLLLETAMGFSPEIFRGEMGEGYSHAINFCDIKDNEELNEKLFIENYIYEVENGNLNIYGTRRGNMYAVYDIAEEYLGFRFYLRDYAYQYTERYSEIPEGTYVYREPALFFRNGGVSGGSVGSEMHELNLLGRKMNGIQSAGHYREEKYGTVTGPHFINAHSYGYYWKMATGNVDVIFDGTNNNDYSAKYEAGEQKDESTWNPCFTSDAVYATLFRGLLETMRYMQDWEYYIDHKIREHTSAMSFSICDNRTVCTCLECKFIMTSGTQGRKPNTINNLNCGEAGLNLYLANRACKDITAYYEGRAASTKEYGENTETSMFGYGEPIKDCYPGIKIYTILYDHSLPNEKLFSGEGYAEKYGYGYDAIIPQENLIIMFCGVACNNHFIGSGECGNNYNNLGSHCQSSVDSLKGWGQVCKQTGSQMWFWYYPVNYNMKLVDTPNVFNIYHDFKYMIEECNVTGVYFESATSGNVFEPLKGHLASILMYDFYYDENGELHYMSEEDFHRAIKEYLMMYYGAGYEYIYEFLVYMDEAGNEAPCFINNFDRPGDMFGYDYIRTHYEEMRAPLVTALKMTSNSTQRDRVEKLLICCDFLGLSANYKDYYVNGTEDSIAVYTNRYIDMYNKIKAKNIRIYSNDTYTLPEKVDVTISPMESFYEAGSWRITNADTWGYCPNSYGWGYEGVV